MVGLKVGLYKKGDEMHAHQKLSISLPQQQCDFIEHYLVAHHLTS